MTHPIIQDLQQRYTCKRYDANRKVCAEDLDIFLEALRLSASSINSQPWKFIVISSDNAKQRMHNTFAHNHQFNQKHVYESSHTILFANHPRYGKNDFDKVVDKYIEDGRVKAEERDSAYGALRFVDMNTNEQGDTEAWTRAQTYLALGNALHTLARLKIDSTCLEGIDSDRVQQEFAKELNGYVCKVALAIGYHHPQEDYNFSLPKSRLNKSDVITLL
ncbi:MAG: nitroreductase family protein [Gammaproteobacteria bacterium]|nr:nitroreductase family protein [Gammaproteobacteria bacterium]MDH5729140.1 nitroreductase family protein [Gammaproteobacteria bacterium]